MTCIDTTTCSTLRAREMAANKKEKRRTAIDFTCPQCGTIVGVEQAGEGRPRPACKPKVGKGVPLQQLPAPRRGPSRWPAALGTTHAPAPGRAVRESKSTG